MMLAQHHLNMRSGEEERTEAELILSQYLDLYSHDCNMFKFYFAANGAVDWFGRTIRGNGKIHEFLRTDVCFAYEHLHFRKAQFCDPIEYKPSHLKTQEIPKESVIPTETGKLFKKPSLKSYADSDTESDQKDTMKEKDGKNDLSFLDFSAHDDFDVDRFKNVTTPPPSNIDLDDCGPTAPKRLKRTLFTNETTKIEKTDVEETAQKADDSTTAGCSSSTNNPFLAADYLSSEDNDFRSCTNACDNPANYSCLKYIEAIGTLRSVISPKYRGVGGSRYSAFTASSESLEWSDREVRIKISYRTRSVDNQVHFALVIYENLIQPSRISRRNLIDEFSKVADVDNQMTVREDDGSDVCMFKSPPSTPSKAKRQADLKSPKSSKNSKHNSIRSLRFF